MSAPDGRAAPRDLAREHRLHDRFRGPPRASPVRFQVSRRAGRSNVARLGARGASGRMPLPRAGHPTARAVKASAPLKTAARRPCVVVVVVVGSNSELPQAGASQNLGKYIWLELRRLPPIMGFVGSAPGLVTLLA